MKYIGLVMGESMKLVTPVGQQLAPRLTMSFPASTISFRLRIASRAQGWRMGLLRSASDWVGCLPVTRYSSLVTCGRDGSCRTGPGPLAGGMNVRLKEYQPISGLGAKFGGSA